MSSDQFVVEKTVWLPSGFGREVPNSLFHGGTIFNDVATGIILVENHILVVSGETVMKKQLFEECLFYQSVV